MQSFEADVRSQIVALVKHAMIEKLLAGSGKARDIMTADKTGEGFFPIERQALQAFEKPAVKERLVHTIRAF